MKIVLIDLMMLLLGDYLWGYELMEICASPAIGSDGTVYVATRVGTIYAFNSTGKNIVESIILISYFMYIRICEVVL